MSALRRAWPVLKRLLLAAFLITVAVLLFRQAREVDWASVGAAMRSYPAWLLAACAGLAVVSYALYCSFDVLARRYAGHTLPARRVAAIAFVSYAFNLNMGAMIGGGGFRLRLYSRHGLRAGTIGRVFAFSVIANWSGYVLLLGLVFAAREVPVPAGWEIGANALQAIGFAMVLLAPAWVAACAWSPKRSVTVRGHTIELPTGRLAAAQLLLSSCNWMVMAAIVFLLLGREIEYVTVLGVLLMAAVAGALAHIPAGLGVLEAVFVVTLSGQLGRPDLLAALLAYRAIYYLAPLVIATGVYLLLETSQSARAPGGGSSVPTNPAPGSEPSMRS